MISGDCPLTTRISTKRALKIRSPLPRIDQIIDAMAGHELLSFLDTHSGYHHIKMKVEDQEPTVFITPYGAFCYITMPFWLKNAGATYQRMIQKCLDTQISLNVAAYVDEVVIKNKIADTLIADLRQTFANLHKFNIKLKPNMCVFGVPSGKLLGFIVSQRGVECNPDKIKALSNIKTP